ncbi:hypothetical protein [Vibrio chagasii]|uniref:hypothetical protein n=1 Tax=Vibrio chagasii TaxID=170679 RepID=UPI003DA0053E
MSKLDFVAQPRVNRDWWETLKRDTEDHGTTAAEAVRVGAELIRTSLGSDALSVNIDGSITVNQKTPYNLSQITHGTSRIHIPYAMELRYTDNKIFGVVLNRLYAPLGLDKPVKSHAPYELLLGGTTPDCAYDHSADVIDANDYCGCCSGDECTHNMERWSVHGCDDSLEKGGLQQFIEEVSCTTVEERFPKMLYSYFDGTDVLSKDFAERIYNLMYPIRLTTDCRDSAALSKRNIKIAVERGEY